MDENPQISPNLRTEDSPLVEDLAVLCDGPAFQVHISFDGAMIAVRSNGRLIFGTSAERGWQVARAKARAQLVLTWLREAPRTYRERYGVEDARSSSQGRFPSPSSDGTVRVLFTYGSSGWRVMTPVIGRLATRRCRLRRTACRPHAPR